MISRDYLIIGAGLAAASVCEGIRKYDKKGSIAVIGNEAFLPYHRPPLSKDFLKSSANQRPEKLFVHDEKWFAKNHVDLRLNTVVSQFNIDRRIAVLKEGQSIEFKKACLATGCRARRPEIAGAKLGNIFYLRTIRDALALKEAAALSRKAILIVGGGFIAVEAAASLTQAGYKVTLVNRNKALWQTRLDSETSQWLTDYFARKGVTLMLGEDISGFEGKTVLKNGQTKSGQRFPAEIALVAVGAIANLELVANTPLSSPGGVPVNEYFETDEKGIYAAGDIALYPDRIFGVMRRLEHWDAAVQQGLIVGANLTGKKRQRFDYVPYFFSDLFDLKFEFLGDFSRPPLIVKHEGSLRKKRFIARYYRGEKLTGVVLCNQDSEAAEAAREEIRAAHK